MTDRQELQNEISREDTRLTVLKAEVEKSNTRLNALREQLAAEPPLQIAVPRLPAPETTPTPMTNAAKVALFRSLFRGREDVFPRRWENAKNGKSGYSPACTNEWEYGLCAKKKGLNASRRVHCCECPSQAFIPVSDEEIAKHLRGDQIMGVYPLLPDDTCWFLAADFDKKTWHDDVMAFIETCDTHGIPVAIERSRSGNGAHAWFFFASPVPAATARKLGCFLITETMAHRHQLSMESYDRLFPNQDTMPKGGFGNLIALPFQRHSRDAGNTVLVDAVRKPWSDQWTFLAGIKRLDATFIHALAEEAASRGQVIGVRVSETLDDDDLTPWTRPPSGRPRKVVITAPLPPKVKAVLSQRLFIEKAGLPSPLLNELKRLAAFQNPEFYRKQSMRLSTVLTPRVIACAEDSPEHITLPRGCLPDAEALLRQNGVAIDVKDKREGGTRSTSHSRAPSPHSRSLP